MSEIVQRNLRLPSELVWDNHEAQCYLEVKNDCVEVTVYFVPNNRTYIWYSKYNDRRGPEVASIDDRGPNQRLDLWLAKEIFDGLTGSEIDKFLSIAIENEIRRCFAWNDFMFYDLEKREV